MMLAILYNVTYNSVQHAKIISTDMELYHLLSILKD